MKIKSARLFREWYKNSEEARKQASEFWNENFIGAKNGNQLGFFNMYHGDKVQVYDFLRKEVEMADDGQAIYEFVQNAADSNSTKFYMFYDENYLIVINNGDSFTTDGIKSILNIGQSYGKQDPDKIGRYGIGFKLVHRLVGKSSGLDELLNKDNKGYGGPILFSWSDKSQFIDFLNSSEFEYVDFENNYAPWLLKILITNFPAQPSEQVKDIDFNEIVPFQAEELKSFQTFLNSCIDKIDLNTINNGTIFFLKLGDKKFDYLEKQQKEYLNGLTTSMHFLKSLDTLVINENVVSKDKEATNVLELLIQNGSNDYNEIGLTEIRDKESDVKFKICFSDNANSANEIKKHPNIYKYFPAVKEVNNLSFVIHSNLFELSSNRQNLTESPVNKNLLKLLSKQLIEKMEVSKSENRNTFKNLFTSVLMSEGSSSNSSGNGWQSEFFYNILLEYIQKTIPTKDNDFSKNAENVKINKLKLKLNLSDFGLSQIKWFEWDNENNKLLVEEAKKAEKLGISSWDIRDIVENAKLESINNWIANCDNQTYKLFLQELEESHLRKETKEKICQIKLFPYSDGKHRSFSEISFNPKNFKFNNELGKLGFAVPKFEISKFQNICTSTIVKPDKEIYLMISEKCKQNSLTSQEKKTLFLCLKDFDNVGQTSLMELHLFCDYNSTIKPLNKLIGNIKTPSWLNHYKIKQDEYFAELNQYLISESEDIFKKIYEQNKDDILPKLTTEEEIKSLIQLYLDNQKSFFKEFIIRKENSRFVIEEKTNDTYQVQSADKEARKFIEENCTGNLFVLPYEFVEKYKEEDGIIKADDLHSLILDLVDLDEHKEILVDIVKYKAKYKFLQDLSEFRFNSETKYTKETYEYKILDLACAELKENDYEKFKVKVIIEAENQELKLTEVPPFTDNLKIGAYELNLAKILPNNYEKSGHLNSLLNQFIGLGLNKEQIGNLFGVSEEPELSDIFQIFSEQVETLENSEQLAFLFLYGMHVEVIDFEKFKALNVDEEYISIGTDKYLTEFNFLQQSQILNQKYRGITKIFKEFPVKIVENENLSLIKEPYFDNNKFVCPYIKDDLTVEEKTSFLEFLFNQWKNKKTEIKNIDWSKIEDVETENILDFNPVTSVYPSKYACKSEAHPDYLVKWINNEKSKIDFLADLGIWTENSAIVEFREYLNDKINDFQINRLKQEIRFNENETVLFNSFEWLKEKEIRIKTTEQFDIFKKVVEIINDNRAKHNDLRIEEEFDFEELLKKSTEWEESYYENWKEESNVTIFLYEGELPKSISLDEIEDYSFYYFHEGNIAILDGNKIFINQNADVKKELRILELENNDFNFDDLWQNKIELLEKENARLRSKTEATLGSENSTDISKNDQKESNREAKEIVREKLENEGFEFTEGIGKYSTINGIFKNEIEYPLVVKSYQNQDEPLKIGANEWIQLMRPNSMFWVCFGNRKIGCLKLHELLRNQDNLTISFSTENLDKEDRLAKFAELLHYFGNVHFDFNSVKLSDSGVAKDLSDYSFDERRNEEDLSGDDEQLL